MINVEILEFLLKFGSYIGLFFFVLTAVVLKFKKRAFSCVNKWFFDKKSLQIFIFSFFIGSVVFFVCLRVGSGERFDVKEVQVVLFTLSLIFLGMIELQRR